MSGMEALFQKAEKWFIKMDQKRRGFLPSENSVRFEDIQSFLNCWCLLISGRSWTLQEAETWPARDAVRLCFPAVLEIFKDRSLNRKAYLYIACMMLGSDETNFPELKKWRQEFQSAARVMETESSLQASQMLHQTEGLSSQGEITPWHPDSFRSLLNLWTVRHLEIVPNRRQEGDGRAERHSAEKKERKKKAREKIQIIEQIGDPDSENPLIHSFEKLHTTDDYKGGQKRQDGEDELEDHQDSLEDLDLRQVIRTRKATQATLKGDFAMDLEVAESLAVPSAFPSRSFFYDEWDESKSLYHSRWCRLEERRDFSKSEGVDPFDLPSIKNRKKREIEQVTRYFMSMFRKPRWKTRQTEGSELDLDALLNLMTTPVEKRSEKLKVYMNQRKEISDLAIVLLFDRSLSSDSWIDNRRVLDITRESLVVIGEALGKFPLPVQLASFSSNTRNNIYYDVLKDFDENWKRGLENLGCVEPAGYTRIGPALRHASSCLQNRNAKHKFIFLISDAKPTDFDKYEGHYGVRDVRKAVQESRRADISVHCLSVEKRNRYELAEMFGPRGYDLLQKGVWHFFARCRY